LNKPKKLSFLFISSDRLKDLKQVPDLGLFYIGSVDQNIVWWKYWINCWWCDEDVDPWLTIIGYGLVSNPAHLVVSFVFALNQNQSIAWILFCIQLLVLWFSSNFLCSYSFCLIISFFLIDNNNFFLFIIIINLRKRNRSKWDGTLFSEED